MAILFGNSASRNQSKNLLEFKAGKMSLKGNTVHPDKRKGLIYVHQTDDSLMHFCWKDRTSGTVEDDLIIFPEDVEFKRVPACTTGRVFVMKFKSTNRKFFFWMQEPKTEKDDEYCSKVNDYLNNPPAPGSGRSGGSTPANADHAEGDLQNLFSAMNQQQFMQLLGGMGGVSGMANLSSLLSSHGLGSQFTERSSNQSARGSAASGGAATVTTTATTTVSSFTTSTSSTAAVTTAAATTTTTTASPASTTTAVTATPPQSVTNTSSTPIQLSDFQNILSGITARSAPPQENVPQAVDLSRALTAEALQPILSNSEFMQRIQELLPNVGDSSSSTTEHLRATVQSPQFQQAFSAFSAALHSGQLGPLIHQFGMSEEVAAAAAQGDLEAFVNALQASQKKEDTEKKSEDKKDDEDDEMALD